MTNVRLTLSAERRFWTTPAMVAIMWTSLFVAFISMRASDWIVDKGCAALARYGFKFELKQ